MESAGDLKLAGKVVAISDVAAAGNVTAIIYVASDVTEASGSL